MDETLKRLLKETDIAYPVPVDAAPYRLPSEVHLEEKEGEWFIAWRPGGDDAPEKTHDDWMLTGFMELKDAEPSKVEEFAATWGTLQLCRHGKPQSHLPYRLWDELAEFGQAPCDVRRPYPGGWRRESVDRWQQYASQASAIYRLAGALATGGDITRADLNPLEDLFPPNVLDRPPDDLRLKGAPTEPILLRSPLERLLSAAIRSWLGMGDVGFRVTWEDEESSLQFGGTGMFSSLALQLALASTGSHRSLFRCHECRQPFPPKRAGVDKYCKICRDKGIPARNRQRRRRAKQRPAAAPKASR